MDILLAFVIMVMVLYSPLVWNRTRLHAYGYYGVLIVASLVLLLKTIS